MEEPDWMPYECRNEETFSMYRPTPPMAEVANNTYAREIRETDQRYGGKGGVERGPRGLYKHHLTSGAGSFSKNFDEIIYPETLTSLVSSSHLLIDADQTQPDVASDCTPHHEASMKGSSNLMSICFLTLYPD